MVGPQDIFDNDPISEFRDKLQECTMKGVCGRDYILVRKLTEWMKNGANGDKTQPNRVARLLHQTYRNNGQPELPISADQICAIDNRAILVFSMLLDIGYGKLIKEFHRHQIFDTRLPSDMQKLRAAFRSLRSHDRIEQAARKFHKRQWAFIPATFDLHLGQEWARNRVIPVLNKEEINVGGTAKVYQIEIQEEFVSEQLRQVVSASRYNNTNDCFGYRYELALKVFQEGKRELYENEADAFLALKEHDGMVRYLTDYGHTETHPNEHSSNDDMKDEGLEDGEETRATTTYNILLEFGEQDLEEYFGWRLPPVLQNEVEKFWKDLFELAGAVKGIHDFEKQRGGERQGYYGWHADIKPENILWVRGKFKLADPGFARFVKNTDRDNIVLSGGTTTYGAPECYPRQGPRVPVPRTIDIWSLGCVFSIAATWVVLGYQGIRQYNRIRKRAIMKIIQARASLYASREQAVEIGAGDYFHDGVEVLQDVRHWHDHLRNSLRRTDTMTSHVLDIVDGNMLRADAKERIEAKDLYTRLSKILDGDRPEPTVLLPETIIEALLEVNEEAPSEPTSLKHPSPGMSLAAPQNRTARKSKLFDTPLMKTAQRSEILKSALVAHNTMPKGPTIIYESPTEDEPSLTDAPLSWGAETGGQVLEQEMPMSHISHNHSRSIDQFTLPAPLKRPLTSLSISNMTTNSPQNATKDPHKPQNVFQVRAEIERHQKSSLLGRIPFDEYLGRLFGERDIKFLVDNAGSMEDFWDEATYLLETFVMKAKGQDEDGMDLSFTNGNVRLTNAKKPSKFKEAMQDPKAKPMPGVDTDMRRPLGDIFSKHLGKVREKGSFLQRQEVKNLVLIVLTDGKWEGMGANRYDVDGMIVKFLKDLEKDMQTLQYRPVSIQFIQFGNDPDATYRLRRLDDDLIHSQVPDVVDTEPSHGDINKMLLGSFVEGIDGRNPPMPTSPPGSPEYAEPPPITPPRPTQPFFGSPEQRISPPQSSQPYQLPLVVDQPRRSFTGVPAQTSNGPRRSASLISSRYRSGHTPREGGYSKA